MQRFALPSPIQAVMVEGVILIAENIAETDIPGLANRLGEGEVVVVTADRRFTAGRGMEGRKAGRVLQEDRG